ncbi:MAG: DUF3772 domain-containing protein [Beijerinckiaceae bacterium]
MFSSLFRAARPAVLALFLAGAPGAWAQAPAPSVQPPAQASIDAKDPETLIEQAKIQLDQVTAALKRDSLDDAALQALNAQLGPAGASAQSAIDTLTPRLAAAKARLDQLGPKPDEKAPPESPSVTADRDEQQKLYNATDDSMRRAKLLSLQIEQTGTSIVSRRRAMFVSTLFQRSRSILSPDLWGAVATEYESDLRALRYVTGDFVTMAADRLAGWRGPLFLALVALIGLLNIPLYRIVQRILKREPAIEEPTRLRKALGACWIALVASILPIVTVILFFGIADAFGLIGPRLMPLQHALVQAVIRVAFTAGLARGLLAPSRPNWRLIPMSDQAADRLAHLAIAAVVIVSLVKIDDSFNEIIGASVAFTAAVQGVGAFVFALVCGVTLYGLRQQEDEDEECLGPRVVAPPRWAALVRIAAWTAVIAILAASLSGYIPFASFIVDQCLWIGAISAALLILVPLLTEAIEDAFQPSSRFGRMLVSSIGVRREGVTQFGIVLSGVVQLILLMTGLFAIVAPWGVQSDDLAGALRKGFFGFQIGELRISPSSMLVALAMLAIAIAVTRAIQNWLEDRLMPATSLDAGLRNSIRTSVGYVGYIFAVSLALAQIGLGLDKIAIVAGALSVGIGFGLNSIINNFVSGIIVLWERAVRVGDLVVIGDEQGFVRKINVRATEIETFDRATMIVPNSNLITGVVKNWVRNDRVARIRIPVTLATNVDPEKVREIMTGAARGHEQVSKIPAPATMFVAIESAGLKFELVCFVEDVETSGRVKSDLHYEIFAGFQREGISVSSPPSVQVMLQGHAADEVAQAIVEQK